MRALLVYNPTAGTRGHDKDSTVDALHLADYKLACVSSKEDDLKSALKEHYDLVVAGGVALVQAGGGDADVRLARRFNRRDAVVARRPL
jgi:diacylglycerol kinase family enzyme